MSTTSNILLVCNQEEEAKNFQSYLLLLRGIDSIKTAPPEEAMNACRQYTPDLTIIFSNNQDESILEICKAIRKDSITKNTPIIVILDEFNEDFVLSCFDAEVDDYIVSPVKQADVLTRAIWGLKKNQTLRDLDKKENLLSDLKILDKQTGIYSKTAVPRVLANEINSANKYNYPLCLMAIRLNLENKSNLDDLYLGDKVKKAVRNADVVCNLDDGVFYIILPRTSLDGVNAVFKKISSSISDDFIVAAGACSAFGNINDDTIERIVENSLKESLTFKENKLTIKEYQINSEGWLDKVDKSHKNYKFFKQVFSKKLSNVIVPVFEKTKEYLDYLYKDHSKINFKTSECECEFAIKNIAKNISVTMKLTDTGLPKTVVDYFYTKLDITTSSRSAVNLQELNAESLEHLLENLHTKFKEMLEE